MRLFKCASSNVRKIFYVITRHEGYCVSQTKRKRVEECFGWLKTIGGLRKSPFVSREKLGFQFVLTFAAYNLVRMRNLGVVSC